MTGTDHAVVIGASVAGLLAAAVLSESFPRVTVYERDILPAAPGPRRGVPQDRQLHALHARGAQVLAELLPGLREEIVDAGGVVADTQRDARWYLDDYLLKPAATGLEGILLSRPLLEWLIRSRVTRLPNVTISDGTDVTGVAAAAGRVTGVLVQAARAPAAAAPARTVAASLVADASGRGSRAPAWLAGLGFPAPDTSRVRVRVSYVGRRYTRDPAQLGGRVGAIVAPYPGRPRGGAVLRQEGDQFLVLLAGMTGTEPPLDEAGQLAFADSLACPDLAAVMRESAPLGPPVKFSYPESTWRHYESLRAGLGGFLVIGDAFSSFNPVYGQGMTIAALEARLLRELLSGTGPAELPPGFERRYFRAAGRLVGAAWATSATSDLRFPAVTGKRRPGTGLVNAYGARYRAAASVDPVLGETFLRVANMIDKPSRLLSPGHLLRVVRSAGKAVRAGT